ncbi:hypothetical protein [Streptomyces sp. NBC_01276]
MTVSDSERPHSQLSRFEDIPHGGAVVVEAGIGKLTVETAELPVDPGTAG